MFKSLQGTVCPESIFLLRKIDPYFTPSPYNQTVRSLQPLPRSLNTVPYRTRTDSINKVYPTPSLQCRSSVRGSPSLSFSQRQPSSSAHYGNGHAAGLYLERHCCNTSFSSVRPKAIASSQLSSSGRCSRRSTSSTPSPLHHGSSTGSSRPSATQLFSSCVYSSSASLAMSCAGI